MAYLTKKVFSGALLFLVLALSGLTALGAPLENTAELEAFFDGMFALQMQQHIPGISLVIVQNGEIIFSKGYGYADFEHKKPFTPHTLHRVGSNSKLLVCTAVMQLVEQGHLDLHEDINHYLDFAIPSSLSNGQEASPITLHHLLTHTAGFEDIISQLFVTGPNDIQPLGEYVRNNLPGRVFAPGVILAYSNYGATLAGYIVEIASGRPFGTYVQENILEPLNMTTSTFLQPLPEALEPLMSKGYVFEEGKYRAGQFEWIQSYPAGALTSSSQDMARLLLAYLQLGELEGERILRENTARLMQEQHFSEYPGFPGMAYGFIEGEVNGYRVLAHGGDTGLFHTGLYLLPSEQTGLYVVYNSAGSAEARSPVFQEFMNRYFPPQTQSAVIPRPISAGTAHNYLGLFYPTRSNHTKWEAWLRLLQNTVVSIDEEGYLVLDSNGTPERYGEIGPGLFQKLDGDQKLAVTYEEGRLAKIHLPGANTLLRTAWHQSPALIIPLLVASTLFMAIVLIGWIAQLFRKKQDRNRFVIPKILGLGFMGTFTASVIAFSNLMLNLHPDLGIPRIFLESPSGLKPVFVLTKLLLGFNVLMLMAALHAWSKRRGSLWQRVYYTLLTLLGGGTIWLLWMVNLL